MMRFTIRDSQKMDCWIKDILNTTVEHQDITNKFLVPYVPGRYREEVALRLSVRHQIQVLQWGALDVDPKSNVLPCQTITIQKELPTSSLVESTATPNDPHEDRSFLIIAFGVILLVLSGLRAMEIL